MTTMSAENQNLEVKSRVENFKDLSKTACAFANANGGRFVIGIANDGRIVGIPENELDALQQRSEGAIQRISPVPFHKISVETKEEKKVIVVEVYQIGQGAFCTFDGITYYRAGSVNSKLEGRTLQEFLINRHILSFDESRSQAKLEDIDIDKLRNLLKRRSPELEFKESDTADYLINLGLAQRNGELWIKNSAILFLAKEPTRFIPQSEIKLVRFAGTKAVEIIDSKFAKSTFIENLREAEAFIKKNTRTALRIQNLERKEVPEYPERATREALINALTHRDYFSRDAVQINIFDDRIEFINPGTLPSGLTLQLLGTLSIQRNPVTYRIMRDLRLVEGLATGVPRMREAMKEVHLPEPVFEELGSFFRVTLYNRQPSSTEPISERQKRAFAYLEKNPLITSKTYQKLAGVTYPVAIMDLNALCVRGFLKKIGKTRGAYYVKAGNKD
jgi:ATP-dependent DNA helicase RecG